MPRLAARLKRVADTLAGAHVEDGEPAAQSRFERARQAGAIAEIDDL